jgi:hypothetical protein
MSEKLIDIGCGRLRTTEEKQKISTAIRKATRESRSDILKAHGYHELWLGAITRNRYVGLLRAHLEVRRAIEDMFDAADGELRGRNLANNEEKMFAIHKYVTPQRRKSQLLESDLKDFADDPASVIHVPPQAQKLIEYMLKVKKAYAPGLLGVLYMLEESVACMGPAIARNLDRQLMLEAKGTRYLRGENRKQDLWELRQSLDLISDYQTQVNVVTAANISYVLYRDLIDPLACITPVPSMRLN